MMTGDSNDKHRTKDKTKVKIKSPQKLCICKNVSIMKDTPSHCNTHQSNIWKFYDISYDCVSNRDHRIMYQVHRVRQFGQELEDR